MLSYNKDRGRSGPPFSRQSTFPRLVRVKPLLWQGRRGPSWHHPLMTVPYSGAPVCGRIVVEPAMQAGDAKLGDKPVGTSSPTGPPPTGG